MKAIMIIALSMLTHAAFASDPVCMLKITLGGGQKACITATGTSNGNGITLYNPRVEVGGDEYLIEGSVTASKICEALYPQYPYAGGSNTAVRGSTPTVGFDGEYLSIDTSNGSGQRKLVFQDYISCFKDMD